MRIAFQLNESVPLEDEVFRRMSEKGWSRNCLGKVTVDDHHSFILIRGGVELSLGAMFKVSNGRLSGLHLDSSVCCS